MRFKLIIWMLLSSGFAFAQSQTREVFMCKSTTLRLKAESVGAQQYQWYHNNELILGTSSHELIVSEEGTYNAFGVNEGGCLSDVSIKIIVRHHVPTAVDDFASCKKNVATLIDVMHNDLSVCTDLDGSTLVVTQQPASGTIASIDGKFLFTPANNFEGKLTFKYTVSDKSGKLSNEALVSVEVTTDPLPVVLTYFEARKNELVADLDWATSQESNSDYFEVQRTTDMNHWTRIGSVPAATESSEQRRYTLTDSLPESGLNYYRLKMVDADNTFTYSRVRSVHFPEFSWAEVYPNPVDDLLNIVIRNRRVNRVRLISNAGTVRLSQPVVNTSFVISMKQYPIGMYYIHFEQDDGVVKIYKLMHN